MKYVIFILFVFPLVSYTQQSDTLPKFVWGGEYRCIAFVSNTGTFGTAYSIDNNGASQFSGITAGTITGGCSGAHDYWIIDGSGNVYGMGDNQNGSVGNGTPAGTPVTTMSQLSTDSSGNPFTGVVQIRSGTLNNNSTGGWTTIALKSNGTVWIWGSTVGGGRGISGYGGITNNTRPVQVPGLSNIVQIEMGEICAARNAAGTIFLWGGNDGKFNRQYDYGQGTLSPVQDVPTAVVLPAPAVDMAGGGVFGFVALLNNGHLYIWGKYTGILGIGDSDGGGQAYQSPMPSNTTPVDFNTAALNGAGFAFPKPYKRVFANSLAIYVILTDSTIWGWGDDVTGVLGDGIEPNYATTPSPYNWNISFGNSYNIVRRTPTQIFPGTHNWVAVFAANPLNYYSFFENSYGDIYGCGRNKGGPIGNGIVDCDPSTGLEGARPNSWDVTFPEKLTVIGGSTFGQSCPGCIGNLGFDGNCSNCSYPSGNTVTAHLTATYIGNNKVVLDASTSSSNQSLHLRYRHTQVSGSTYLAGIQTLSKDTIIVPGTGTYTAQVKVTDIGWVSNTASITFTVGCTSCWVRPRAGRRKFRNL